MVRGKDGVLAGDGSSEEMKGVDSSPAASSSSSSWWSSTGWCAGDGDGSRASDDPGMLVCRLVRQALKESGSPSGQNAKKIEQGHTGRDVGLLLFFSDLSFSDSYYIRKAGNLAAKADE